ncbi:hypothetical protein JTE90_004842 [Oedothorax gibbosus]|uniref:BTB domain-containing protein n=1 Tax=Oedothorax gibbosus TaxID=931172 RepID=A0AAV6URR5_9ARAC|nr:hypothetical protein JTE90_004842 [Oedothorax gibbosus]
MIENMELKKKRYPNPSTYSFNSRNMAWSTVTIDAGPPKRDVLKFNISPEYIKPFLKFLYTDKLYADDLT